MTRTEAAELVGCIVRVVGKHGRGRSRCDRYARLVALVGEDAVVRPPGHGHNETVPLDALRRSVKHSGHPTHG